MSFACSTCDLNENTHSLHLIDTSLKTSLTSKSFTSLFSNPFHWVRSLSHYSHRITHILLVCFLLYHVICSSVPRIFFKLGVRSWCLIRFMLIFLAVVKSYCIIQGGIKCFVLFLMRLKLISGSDVVNLIYSLGSSYRPFT